MAKYVFLLLLDNQPLHYSADNVVIAVSLGVLQHEGIPVWAKDGRLDIDEDWKKPSWKKRLIVGGYINDVVKYCEPDFFWPACGDL